MANPTGFLQYPRVEVGPSSDPERIQDWHEIDQPLVDRVLNEQAARCMDCGIPFCHAAGCPVKNRIPEFNDLVYRNRWQEAAENLHSTNNFPEITGRVCPAPCEAACTLALNDRPVNIKQIEYQIAERAFAEGWVQPLRPTAKTGQQVAIVGSGPAGLAAAQQLARAGHEVVVFEKDDRLGGLLRYGIPDFKLEKHILDRRLEQMAAEGVKFEPGVNVGVDISAAELRQRFDAVLLCMGAGQPRRAARARRRSAGRPLRHGLSAAAEPPHGRASRADATAAAIHAEDKHVIVIGGGDTGSDCVGTAIRQGAPVTQLEILPRPPEGDNPETPWPFWPKIMRTSVVAGGGLPAPLEHADQGSLTGTDGRVASCTACAVDWVPGPKGWEMREIPGTEFTLPADLVLIAMGFVHVVHAGLVTDWALSSTAAATWSSISG